MARFTKRFNKAPSAVFGERVKEMKKKCVGREKR
jgi:hypothetical protein